MQALEFSAVLLWEMYVLGEHVQDPVLTVEVFVEHRHCYALLQNGLVC